VIPAYIDSTNFGPQSLASDSTGRYDGLRHGRGKKKVLSIAGISAPRAWLSIAQGGYDGLLHEREQVLSIA
jgi:hypothetical protein